jgi:hypothetical protein
MDVLRHTEERSCNPCCSEKTISITYSECAFVHLQPQVSSMQCACTALLSVVCLALQYFFNYLINGMIFEIKQMNARGRVCPDFLFNFFPEKFTILRRIQRDNVINVHMSPCKEPVIAVRFSWNFNFLDTFFEIYSDIKLNGKSAQWEPGCSMRTDRRTNDEANSRFSQLSERA